MRKLQGLALALALAEIAAAGTTENYETKTYEIKNNYMPFSYKPRIKNNHEGINSKSRFKQKMAFKKHCK